MALAPYFDKTALAAATVLRGFDRDRFAATLSQHVVAIVFDGRAVSTAEARVTLELATNLLARLCPHIAVSALDGDAACLVSRLEELARTINPGIEFAPASAATIRLVVGETRVADLSAPTVYVGSDGWVVRVSSEGPCGSGTTSIPFGAAAAACFGAANVFRSVFAGQLERAELDRSFQMSVLDLDPAAAQTTNPSLDDVSLEGAHLVGVGAIGNGAVWTLARLGALRGNLHVVDPERLDGTNPQRYVLAMPTDQGSWKVALAAREFSDAKSQLVAHQHRSTWGGYLASRVPRWRLDQVAVALDSARDRIAVQAALPARILNAWTQAGEVGLSRHEFVGDRACLACLYLPNGRRKNEDQLVAEAIGLPGQLMEVRRLLYTREPIGAALVHQIAGALGVHVDALLAFAGRPLRVFYSEAICGGIVMRLQAGRGGQGADPHAGDGTAQGTEVPMAFQSALAGVLLASALIADAAGLAANWGGKAVIDLLRPLGRYLVVPTAKHPSGRCICQDPDYQQAFAATHIATQASAGALKGTSAEANPNGGTHDWSSQGAVRSTPPASEPEPVAAAAATTEAS